MLMQYQWYVEVLNENTYNSIKLMHRNCWSRWWMCPRTCIWRLTQQQLLLIFDDIQSRSTLKYFLHISHIHTHTHTHARCSLHIYCSQQITLQFRSKNGKIFFHSTFLHFSLSFASGPSLSHTSIVCVQVRGYKPPHTKLNITYCVCTKTLLTLNVPLAVWHFYNLYKSTVRTVNICVYKYISHGCFSSNLFDYDVYDFTLKTVCICDVAHIVKTNIPTCSPKYHASDVILMQKYHNNEFISLTPDMTIKKTAANSYSINTFSTTMMLWRRGGGWQNDSWRIMKYEI